MRYAKILKDDFNNGKGIGVTLFTQGCFFRCQGCFNPETWDYEGGKEYTEKTEQKILDLLELPQSNRFTLLGGEPLSEQNWKDLALLLEKVNILKKDIQVWCYTGYNFETLFQMYNMLEEPYLMYILNHIDVLVDGQFVQEKRKLDLAFKGSTNQRVLDMRESMKLGKPKLLKFD